jgi:hypothetical protein
MKPEQQFNSCVLDSDNLDDWLESDLRQLGILPSHNDDSASVKSSSDCESHYDESDDKTLVGDMKLDLNHKTDLHTNTPLPSPPPVVPILKVLAALTSLQQQGFAFPTPLHSPNHTPRPPTPPPMIPDAINPLHMHKTPAAPSPNIPSTLPAQKYIALDSIKSNKRPREPDQINTATDSLDPVTLKRMKNTDAARRSRQRKLMKMEGLESRVHGLEKQNQQLLLQVAESQRLRDAAKAREASQREKVVALESELAQVQRSLVSRASIKPEKD